VITLSISNNSKLMQQSKKEIRKPKPTSYTLDDGKDWKGQIIKLVQQKPYNPIGYQLYRENIDFETGYTYKWKFGPVYQFTKEHYNQMKGYKNELYYLRGKGENYMQQIVNCIPISYRQQSLRYDLEGNLTEESRIILEAWAEAAIIDTCKVKFY
jgi:hypothetical protein